MSDPPVEEVRKALSKWHVTRRAPDISKEVNDDLETIFAAARMVVDAAEPDIEAAAKAVSLYVHGYELPPDGMRLLVKQLRVGVNAALGSSEAPDGQ